MDWEARWQEKETPWDHGTAAPPLADFLQTRRPRPGTAIVPGCGSGHEVSVKIIPPPHGGRYFLVTAPFFFDLRVLEFSLQV